MRSLESPSNILGKVLQKFLENTLHFIFMDFFLKASPKSRIISYSLFLFELLLFHAEVEFV
jgi:hypothetical protein